jgi:hypothetical protein
MTSLDVSFECLVFGCDALILEEEGQFQVLPMEEILCYINIEFL